MDEPIQSVARIREKLARCRTALGASTPPADAQGLLRERARQLAQRVDQVDTGELLEVIQFRLGCERLAFESAWVKEVFAPREVVAVPGTPPFVAGIVNHRGSILSVVDLAKFLGLPPSPGTEPGVVLYLGDEGMEFGVLIDQVEAANTVSRHAITAVPPTLPEESARYLRGVLPGAVSLIDAGLLLAAPQLRVR
jgi:purine-binding chemotaxis protein CheW